MSVGSAVGVSGQAGLASARRVLELEAKGLQAMAREIDEAFIRALDLIEQMQGRVIVTGRRSPRVLAANSTSRVARCGSSSLATSGYSAGDPIRSVPVAESTDTGSSFSPSSPIS